MSKRVKDDPEEVLAGLLLFRLQLTNMLSRSRTLLPPTTKPRRTSL